MGPLKGSTRGPLKESVGGPVKGSIRGPLKGSIVFRVLGIKVLGDRVEGLVCGLGFSQMKYASVGDIYIYPQTLHPKPYMYWAADRRGIMGLWVADSGFT